MKKKYIPQDFEKKWIELWQKEKLYLAPEIADRKNKFYTLVEFPYPSGAGLHVGHARSWSAMDAYSRKKRMQGYQVLYPIGWDAFGLPAENYALKMGVHPSKIVAENISRFKKQCLSLGFSFDWSREINTTDPDYYKWTQWIFIQLFKKGLAYRAKVPVNWCPICKTNLADEEVLADGTHERCGNITEKRGQEQWLLKITKYADRLLNDLKTVDYSDQISQQQINWIGRSEGVLLEFRIQNLESRITVFTTALDTVFGVTFMVLSPENPLVTKITTADNKQAVNTYIKNAKNKSDSERTALEKVKTGIFTGAYCINPINGEKVPIWVADYVLMSYGTGAVMGVPGHDARDHEFAKKFGLQIKPVIKPTTNAEGFKVGADGFWNYEEIKKEFFNKSILFNSGEFNNLTNQEAKKKLENYIEEKKIGRKQIIYHLRDWIFSRQRYWGEPIPMIFCEKDGWVPVLEKDLPVKLPFVQSYEPTKTGESPLAKIEAFVNTKCPSCGGEAKRETDTMPNWAGSNWYFIRYLDSKNDQQIADRKKIDSWLPVDIYQGGFEHTTLHLLYSRFIYKFLYDIGVVPTKEPYAKRRSHGIVLGPDNRKMSKSFGNVVNPEDIIQEYGADTLRIYEMFIGPFSHVVAWNDEAIAGVYRFLTKVWQLFQSINKDNQSQANPQAKQQLAKLIKRVDQDIENLKFNTMVSACMEFVNFWQDNIKLVNKDIAINFLKVLAPMAPFITEEIWHEVLGEKTSIHLSAWPKVEESDLIDAEIKIPVQINGKVRTVITLSSTDISKDTVVQKALKDDRVQKYLQGKKYQVIYVSGKILNLVVEQE